MTYIKQKTEILTGEGQDPEEKTQIHADGSGKYKVIGTSAELVRKLLLLLLLF